MLGVRLPQFIVRSLPLDLMIYKDQTSEFGIDLCALESPTILSRNMKISVKDINFRFTVQNRLNATTPT